MAKSKDKTVGVAVAGCIAVLVIAVAVDLFSAWILQLIYNAIAPTFHWPAPVGYWTMFYIVCGISIISGFFKSSSK